MASHSESVQSGIPTRTTPTLTPTTMKNIEELFHLPSSVYQQEPHSNQAGFVPPTIEPPTDHISGSTLVDSKHWNGGIVTLIPDAKDVTNEVSIPCTKTSNVANSILTSCEMPVRRTGGRHANRDPKLTAEEEKRKEQRRERNKQAAARCRKRRLDQTNRLQDETDDLQDKKAALKDEIELLRQQKMELEFLLNSHKATCTHNGKKPIRPTSLDVSKTLPDLGISIETPSNCIREIGLGFDHLESPGLSKLENRTSPCDSHDNSSTSNCSSQQRNDYMSSPESNSSSLVSL